MEAHRMIVERSQALVGVFERAAKQQAMVESNGSALAETLRAVNDYFVSVLEKQSGVYSSSASLPLPRGLDNESKADRAARARAQKKAKDEALKEMLPAGEKLSKPKRPRAKKAATPKTPRAKATPSKKPKTKKKSTDDGSSESSAPESSESEAEDEAESPPKKKAKKQEKTKKEEKSDAR
jgi:hypothetical protein